MVNAFNKTYHDVQAPDKNLSLDDSMDAIRSETCV